MVGLLRVGELVQMRAIAVAGMSQSGYVLSLSGAALNSAGGRSAAGSTWTKGARVPCRVWRTRGLAYEENVGGETQSDVPFKLSVPFGTAIDPTKRFQVEGGQVFEVLGVDIAHADAVQVICDVQLVS